MKLVGKIVLILVLLSIALPFVKSACDVSMLSSLQQYQAPMCHLENIGQSLANLERIQQFGHAVVEPMNLLALVLALVLTVIIHTAGELTRRSHIRIASQVQHGMVHMKPWDALRQALSRGRMRRIDYA